MLDSKAYKEAYVIISNLSIESINKIPKKIIENIKNRADKDYDFSLDGKDLLNIKLLDDTEKILSVIYTDYLADEEEREVILNKEMILNKQKNLKNDTKDSINSNVVKLKLLSMFGYKN